MSCGTCGIQASDTMQGDTGVPAGAPTTRPRCPYCQAFISQEGAPCNNPRCPGQALPAITTALQDPSAQVRRQAVWRLQNWGHPAALPLLQQALHDDSPVVRQDAAFALGAIDAAPAALLPVLQEALQHPDYEVRRSALSGASCVAITDGASVLPLLQAVLADDRDSGNLHAETLRFLGRAGAAALPTLQPWLTAPHDPYRAAAAHTLGFTASPDAISPLTTLLADPSKTVREEAAGSLALLAASQGDAAIQPLLDVLRQKQAGLRMAALTGLHNVAQPSALVDQALTSVLQRDPYPKARQLAAQGLGRHLNPTTIAALSTAATHDRVAAVRVQALDSLGHVRGADRDLSYPALAAALSHENEDIREAAAGALAQQRPRPEAFPTLAERLQQETARRVRQNLIIAIAHCGTPASRALLERLWQDPQQDWADKRTALESSVRVAPDQAETYLRSALADPHLAVAAAQQLARLNTSSPETLAALFVAADYPHDQTVRYAALSAGATLGRAQAVPQLWEVAQSHADPWTRRQAARALGETGSPAAVPALAALLQAPDPIGYTNDFPLHEVAIAALGALHCAEAQPVLRPLLQHPNDSLRRGAVAAFGLPGDTAAVPHLLPLLQDPHEGVRQAAVHALYRCGGMAALTPALTHKNAAVRAAAIAVQADMLPSSAPASSPEE